MISIIFLRNSQYTIDMAAPAAPTFENASSFSRLETAAKQLPRSERIDLYTIQDDQFGAENAKKPSSAFLDMFKRELIAVPEYASLKLQDIDYDPDKKTLYSDKVSLPICILPEGSIIHRFDKEGARDPSTNVPIFFGNRTSVKFYSGKAENAEVNATRSSYRVKRPVQLLHINTESMGVFLQLQLTPEEIDFFEVFCRMGKTHPILLPALPYGTVKEIVLGIRAGRPEKTLNRRFAEIVCRLGFDGWVVKPYNPDTNEGVLQITCGINQVQAADGTIVTLDAIKTLTEAQAETAHYISPKDGHLTPMPPELVLCRWDIFMDRVKGGGTRRRRRQSLRTRH
jgi:hypothetical protein